MAHLAESVDKLRSLLRGEISAVETLRQALDKFEEDHVKQELRQILDEHRQAVSQLMGMVSQHGGEPDTTSGPWGAWAKLVTGTAKLFGPQTALAALREGEEHGAKEYQEALEDDDVDAECKGIIRTKLLPAQHNHIQRLQRLIDECKEG